MRYALLRGNIVWAVIEAEESFAAKLVGVYGIDAFVQHSTIGPGDVWDGQNAIPAVAQRIKRLLARFDFLDRLTRAERVALRTIASDNIRDAWEMLNAMEQVDLNHPKLVVLLQQLEGAGILAPGRTVEILA